MGLSPVVGSSPEPPAPLEGSPPSPCFLLSSHPHPSRLLLLFHLRFLPEVVKMGNGSIYLLLGVVLEKVF